MLRKILGKLKSLAGGRSAQPAAAATPKKSARSEPNAEASRGARRPRRERGAGTQRGERTERTPAAEGAARGHRSENRPRDDRRGGRGRDRTEPRGRPERAPDEAAPPVPVAPVELPAVDPDHAFRRLGLGDAVVAAVAAKGYATPTPIQEQAIPIVLSGRDVMGTAQTGTGKTAAFALPILHRLQSHGALRCLILEPTRELALQVEEALRTYGKFTDLRVSVIYGGVGYGRQREELKRGTDIVVATPGRLLDLMGEGLVPLDHLQVFILDEVDRMLDMGFLPDVRRIIRHVPRERQTLLFSATLPPEIQGLAQSVLRDPTTIEIGIRSSPAETVDHAFYPVVASQKFDLLLTLLEQTNYQSVIVFSRTKAGADRIASRLKQEGHTVGVMHADRSQRERTEALDGFKAGKYELLVATDVASRGLDIRNVTHVINYDVPENPEDYVHRIGRTGRAQTEGDAFTLLTEDDLRRARAIERLIDRPVPRRKVEGFAYVYSAIFSEDAAAAPKPASRLHRGRR
jgi:ATP-dependent RNA helicase RhlE